MALKKHNKEILKYCTILPANGRHLRFQFLEPEIFNITPWQSLKIDTKILKALEHCMLMHLSNLCSSVKMKFSESNDFLQTILLRLFFY